jgi:hypothetical protein
MDADFTLNDVMEVVLNIQSTMDKIPTMVRAECEKFLTEHRDDLIAAATPAITKNILEAVQPMINAQIASNQATVEETMRVWCPVG